MVNRFRFVATLLIVLISSSLFAQNLILGFEDNDTGGWFTANEDAQNVFMIMDNNDEFKSGDASLEIDARFRVYPNDWGTYTEAIWYFDTRLDLSDYDEIRFWVKILEAPTVNRSLIWTCALSDSADGAAGKEVFQWEGDIDLLYGPVDEWVEVVVPFSRLVIPEWMPTLNGTLDTDAIFSFDFGVHGDATAPDSVRFLIDHLTATKSTNVASLFDFEENIFPAVPDSIWTLWIDDDVNNVFELSDDFDNPFEGDGCLRVRCSMVNFPNDWGTAQEGMLIWDEPVDITGATEIRYMMDILQEPNGKNVQLSISLSDKEEGAAEEGWVSRDRWGAFFGYGKPAEWMEMVWPIAELAVPEWNTPVNGVLDLDRITKFSFTVGGNGLEADSVEFLMDRLIATAGDASTAVLGEAGAALSPDQLQLSQNYPNPFNPTTNIIFGLNKAGNTSLKVYNINGQCVKTVVDNRYKIRGAYTFDVDMSEMSSGVYFYVLTQGSNKITKKMTLLK
ncbi:T9SS type A sorting domain-containing protein [bacterium]|nr:T9SS type A sorting domain-containing protein [bacterium]